MPRLLAVSENQGRDKSRYHHSHHSFEPFVARRYESKLTCDPRFVPVRLKLSSPHVHPVAVCTRDPEPNDYLMSMTLDERRPQLLQDDADYEDDLCHNYVQKLVALVANSADDNSDP